MTLLGPVKLLFPGPGKAGFLAGVVLLDFLEPGEDGAETVDVGFIRMSLDQRLGRPLELFEQEAVSMFSWTYE